MRLLPVLCITYCESADAPTLSIQAMWLMNTMTLLLTHFNQPPATYAILSHVWGANEKSFQEVQSGDLSSKITAACDYARADGYSWIWIDTCCIDKTNSAEMSEAINSMYKWYSAASVCYAYLHDVVGAEDPSAKGSAFRRSVWHTRGWTLQELIAPRAVVFVSREWCLLGDKEMLAPLLESITGIDATILTSHAPLRTIPVARKLSWASSRRTTRQEDEAYCLMGIFDINMPVIYGEGRRALHRLQGEILRHYFDYTLFTWGPCHAMPAVFFNSRMNPNYIIRRRTTTGGSSDNVLAMSPSQFSSPDTVTHAVRDLAPYTIEELGSFSSKLRNISLLRTDRFSASMTSPQHQVGLFSLDPANVN